MFTIGLIIGTGFGLLIGYGLWKEDEELDSPTGGASKENNKDNQELE